MSATRHRQKRAELARKNLDNRLGFLRDSDLTRPMSGWLRAIRDSLGMSSRQMAQRMGVSQSRVSELEHAEARGNTTLKSLREAAEALDCRLVYAIVPNKPLDAIIRERASDKAFRELAMVSHGMLLEGQSLNKEQMQEELERLTDEVLEEPLGQLWEAP
jgi:predicted DNA-binding mobile mystery protein A